MEDTMATETNVRELTVEGMQNAKERLSYLTGVRRQEIADQIATARGFGDLSENAEYDQALNEQSRLEAEIQELDAYIRNAVVVDDKKIKSNVAGIGTTVTVEDLEMAETLTWDLVGARESDPSNGKISIESPIGVALNGHKKGETVKVESPGGMYELQIKKIERTKK